VYAPLARVRIVHARKVQFVNRPFLSRYILVRVGSDHTFRLNGAPGVNCVVVHAVSKNPIIVAERFVEQLKNREIDGAIPVGPQDAKSKFRTGDPVFVKSRELKGIFSCTSGEHRAMVFLGAFRAQVALEDLERIQ